LREEAIVVANRGNQAKVRLIKSEACHKCGACSHNKDVYVWANNPVKARIGQSVVLELNPSTFLYATLITYGLPLAAFIIGVAIAYFTAGYLSISLTEPAALRSGLLSMGASMVIIYYINKVSEKNNKFSARIVDIKD